jgi:flagellar motor switch protein FliM
MAALVEQLSLTWEDLLGVTVSLQRVEPKAANLHVAPASEPCLKLKFLVRDAGGEGTLALLVPHRSIEGVLPKLTDGDFETATPGPEPAETVKRTLAGVEVVLRAEIAKFDMKLADVLALSEGSLVPLGVTPQVGVTLYANSVPVQRARPGRSGNRRAVEVIQRLGPAT